MTRRVLLDGCGNAGTAFLKSLATQQWPATGWPRIEIRDGSVWGERHAEAGLIGPAELGLPKAVTARRRLLEAGWPADRVTAQQVDVRDMPRGSYCGGMTVAATDSHAGKHRSVVMSQQVGSPAIAEGLGTDEAIVELFDPCGPSYCCVHNGDPTWQQRQPCRSVSPISTTEIVGRGSRDAVRTAGELVSRIAAYYITTGRLPHCGGFHIRAAVCQPFSFDRQRDCPGPHDQPFSVDSDHVVRTLVPAARLSVAVMLDHVGANGCYADRALGWQWFCHACGQTTRRVHTVHPPMACTACGHRMQPPLERASGLTAMELVDLNEGITPTLAELGLGDETIVRCTTRCGEVIWIELEEQCHDSV